MQYKVLHLDIGDIQNVRHVKFDEHQFPAFGSRTGKFISEEEADNDLESDQDSTPDYAPSASSSDDDSDNEDETNDSDDDYDPQLAISHRSMAARKTPAQGFSHTYQLHHMLQRMMMTPTTCNCIHKPLKSVTIPVGLMRHL
jgi:hypothetical protein